MRDSLNASLLTPALTHLDYWGGSIYFNHALTSLVQKNGALSELRFARQNVALAAEDVVILATPAQAASQLIPGIRPGEHTHSAITLHYAVAHRETEGLVAPEHAPVDLLRYMPGRISVMVRVADAVWHSDPNFLAGRLWRWIRAQHPYLEPPLPKYAVWREKYAGHVLTPNHAPFIPPLPPRLLVAGDWCDADRPASLETAAASGHRAARAALTFIGKQPLRHQ